MSDICFIAAGDETWASSRMRAYWPARALGGEVTTWKEVHATQTVPEADAYVFHNIAVPELVDLLLEQGKQVWWDVCDPSWWTQPAASKVIADMVTGIVASSHELANDCTEWSGRKVHTIPDCLIPEHFPLMREHSDVSPVRLIWFGISPNRIALHAAAMNLMRLKANGYDIELTIFDNQPDLPMAALEGVYPITYLRWALEDENAVLASHDIALLPPYPGPWGKVKSNNKKLTAAMCGLPTSPGECYRGLAGLVASYETRRDVAAIDRREAMSFTIDRAAREWQKLTEL
jgi:hypothetical protein